MKGGDIIEAILESQTNSLHQCLLQMKAGSSYPGNRSRVAFQTELLLGDRQSQTITLFLFFFFFLIAHLNKVSMAQHKTNEL